jgi:hypothetical protein
VFVSITVELRKRPDGSRVTLLVSNDGVTWLPAMPPGTESLAQGSTKVLLDEVLGGGSSFYYRLNLDSDGIDSPMVDKISVAYLR